MAIPRHLLVDPVNECDYHLVSRCVRRAFLCGVDGDRDYSHRRAWLVERLGQIAPCFAVDVYAYTVLSNHFHLVLRHDPLAHRGWTDGEVARRWVEAFPPTERGEVVEELKPERRELILDDPGRVARARCTLGSMSHFMKHLRIESSPQPSRMPIRYGFTCLFSDSPHQFATVRINAITTNLQLIPVAFCSGSPMSPRDATCAS